LRSSTRKKKKREGEIERDKFYLEGFISIIVQFVIVAERKAR